MKLITVLSLHVVEGFAAPGCSSLHVRIINYAVKITRFHSYLMLSPFLTCVSLFLIGRQFLFWSQCMFCGRRFFQRRRNHRTSEIKLFKGLYLFTFNQGIFGCILSQYVCKIKFYELFIQ